MPTTPAGEPSWGRSAVPSSASSFRRPSWRRPPWGAGIGAGAGGLLGHERKKEIKADVEDVLPLNSSGIVAMFEERWVDDVEKALAKADKVTTEAVDADSAKRVKAAATSGG